ncbi:hypothetical protein CR159_14980 [Pollutimonas subterranea]|uniref:Uncharacterized protein n=1 Tax=Pollutimonas subterranea TaxID=2045210 RepID=A0A2N4U228_9BURK|nr:hypothetical protein [Pollutimonas subterranea]PLC49063.1 hypothetical protein CR159_14980 [Pollutimonas subterranea]
MRFDPSEGINAHVPAEPPDMPPSMPPERPPEIEPPGPDDVPPPGDPNDIPPGEPDRGIELPPREIPPDERVA